VGAIRWLSSLYFLTHPVYNTPMTPLIIGERANRSALQREMTPHRWLRIARRVGAFRDLSFHQNVRTREKLIAVSIDPDWPSMNLCPPGHTDDPWPKKFAKEVAGLIGEEILILLGRKVQAAFGVTSPVPFGMLIDGRFLCMPHPSGLNHFWNDGLEVLRTRVMARGALLGAHKCCLCDQPVDKNSVCQGCGRHVCAVCHSLHEPAHMGVVR